MLETVRDYALERLDERSDRQALRARLAAWCLNFAREAATHIGRTDQRLWVTRLDAELPNLLAALSRALDDGHEELALELVYELAPYWLRTGQSDEGLRWIDAAIERSHSAPVRTRANALLERARVAGIRFGERRDEDLRAALELFRSCDDNAGIARCLCEIADGEQWNGRKESASALSDEAMQFAKHAADEETIATALKIQAFTATDYDEMSRRARAALEHLWRIGMLGDAGHLCVRTGYMALAEGAYRDAIGWLTDGLEIARAFASAELVFHLRTNEGLARLFLGEIDEAALAFAEVLAVCHDAACEPLVDESLLGMAAVAAGRRQYRRAARLLGAATRHATALLAHDEAEVQVRLRDETFPHAREAYGPPRA